MLGVAQDVLSIVKNVPFQKLGVEFHIIGGGKQFDDIQQYLNTHPNCGIYLYGYVPKEEIPSLLKEFDASIVPLVTYIRGAFPSKIYDIIPLGLPILLCGQGEPAEFITQYKLGITSAPNEYNSLIDNINELCQLSDQEFENLSKTCIEVSQTLLDFNKQIKHTVSFIKEI
jgi:glycosyltransferase involved in cell wall biosynthesis